MRRSLVVLAALLAAACVREELPAASAAPLLPAAAGAPADELGGEDPNGFHRRVVRSDEAPSGDPLRAATARVRARDLAGALALLEKAAADATDDARLRVACSRFVVVSRRAAGDGLDRPLPARCAPFARLDRHAFARDVPRPEPTSAPRAATAELDEKQPR